MVHLELHKDRLASPVETTLRATLFLDTVENTSQLGGFEDENLEIIEWCKNKARKLDDERELFWLFDFSHFKL